MVKGGIFLKTYEIVCILNPSLANEKVEEKINAWRNIVSNLGGNLVKLLRWGKRTLAYEVDKLHQGIFILMHVQGPHQVVAELERQFKISEDVLRSQTVRLSPNELKVSESIIEKMMTTPKSEMGDGEADSETERKESNHRRFKSRDDDEDESGDDHEEDSDSDDEFYNDSEDDSNRRSK